MRELFGNRSFRRLFAGRLVTNVGDSLYFVGAMWLVYSLTGDPFFSGLAGFLTMAPQGLGAFAGPLVDRWDLRRVLVGTQLIQGTVILALPVAAHLGLLSVWVVLVVMPLLSAINQFVYPAQTAALPRIVEQDELVAANSLFTLAYQGTELVANAAGGVLVALVGAVTLFAVDAVTFGVAALLFVTVSIPEAGAGDHDSPGEGSAGKTGATVADGGAAADGSEATVEDEPTDGDGTDEDLGYRESLLAGLGYVRGTVLVPIILGATTVNFVAGGAAQGVMPAFADTFGGAGAYGLLLAAVAAGSLVGAVAASQFDDRPFGRVAVGALCASGVCWLAAIGAGWLPATAALLALAFVPIGATNVLLGSLVQSVVPDHLLGRVSGLLGSASQAAVPVGALLGGTAATVVGPALVLAAGGVAVLALAVYWLAHPGLRSMGAITEVETL